MGILSFGDDVPGITNAGLALNQLNLDEWNTIYWPQSLLFPASHINENYIWQISNRLKEVYDWLKVGCTLVVTLNATGDSSLAGLGRVLPKAPTLHHVNGFKVKAEGPAGINQIISPFVEHLQYHQVFKAEGGTPFLSMDVTHTSKPTSIGAIYSIEKGFVVIAPPVYHVSIKADYIAALAELPRAFVAAEQVTTEMDRKLPLQIGSR